METEKRNDKERRKKMFPLYMFGSREEKEKGKKKKRRRRNVYLSFVWFAKEEK